MNDLKDRLTTAFDELGFSEHKLIRTEVIPFDQEVYKQCEKNTCGYFGKNHGCPPNGSEEERKQRILKYKEAYLIGYTMDYNFDDIEDLEDLENNSFALNEVYQNLRKVFAQDDVVVMAVGPCTLCKTCTATDGQPCRFPEKTQYSMEGSGIDVVKLSMQEQMQYYAGPGKVVYFAIVLFQE